MTDRGRLIMGDPQAEEIRELHHNIEAWLAAEHYCPLCIDEFADEEEDSLLYPDADVGCPLCEGLGKVTGRRIEEYAVETSDRFVLPKWFPRVIYVEGRA